MLFCTLTAGGTAGPETRTANPIIGNSSTDMTNVNEAIRDTMGSSAVCRAAPGP